MSIKLKFVIVGDGAVGKTCLLYVYSKGEFPKEYTPTIVDNFSVTLNIDGKEAVVSLWDTAGQENFDRIRLLSYPGSDLIIICFSLILPSSLENVREKWIKEIKEKSPDAIILLVGTQCDRINETEYLEKLKKMNLKPITKEQINSVVKEIGAVKYIETSAKENKNVDLVFNEAIRFCLNPIKKEVTLVKKRKSGIFDSVCTEEDISFDLNKIK